MSTRRDYFRIKDISLVLGVAAVYFLGAKLGLSLAYYNASVSPVWPPTGIAIAALLWFGYRGTPGVLLGALLANYLLTDVPLAADVGISLGNTLEALIAVYLVRRYVESRNPFNRAFDVLKFVVFAAIISTGVSATLGNLTLCLAGSESWHDFPWLWLTWWLGDAVGALIVTPLILSWGEKPVERWQVQRWIEFSGLMLLLTILSMTIYTGVFQQAGTWRPWGHLAIPLLVWAAFRFGPRGVATSMLVLAAISIWGTIKGYGTFAFYGQNDSLLFLQAYVGDLAITSLALAAIVTERKVAGRHLEGSLAVTRILAESPALDAALPRILQRICKTFDWEVGVVWGIDQPNDVLKCLKVFPSPGGAAAGFEKLSYERTFATGVGLPGRVWQSLKPAWIPDVTSDQNFPRAPAAAAAGLHAALAFPIMSGEKFLGVMEFFSYEIRQPDCPLLDACAGIGGQIGQFLERKGVEEERERALVREHAARNEAEEANRLKDEFLATLSHELRTPLTAMLGWLSMLRGGRLDHDTVGHALETVERNARAQAQLIEDLVDVSRIAGGKLKLEVAPVDLRALISAAVDVVRPAADARGVLLHVATDASVGPVAGDASRLQQVIWNLLSNAVKFTQRDGHVYISLRRVDSFAEIEVRDTGIGIAPDFLPSVFERFRQAESPVTRSHRGLGLGLAIVRHLTELHGGTVSAESAGEGLGASFKIQIPLASSEVPKSDPQPLQVPGSDHQALNGLRVLLVEDEPDARELLLLTLQVSGATVTAVDTVERALGEFRSFRPHVLVSDVGLPVESGYDLIRKVRALPDNSSRVPALALTAFASEKDREQALAAGFQLHLAKPVDPDLLIDAIRNLAGANNSNHGKA
jgi:signal transduction histidine kinase/integral membrane sensor domain MASE1/ActR/RegA family two-component response regulator